MTYPIAYLLLVAFGALRAGYNDYVAFEHHARHYAQEFQALYARLTGRKLRSYTPSHDTFSRALGMLAPGQCRDAFKQWLKALFELVDQHICIDGRAMRGVKKLAPEARAPAVSAYYPAIRTALDQVFISEKDNAITAIPELLALFDTQLYKAKPQHAGSLEVGHGRVEERHRLHRSPHALRRGRVL